MTKPLLSAEVLARIVLPGEQLVEVFEGTMWRRYVLTDKRLLNVSSDGSVGWMAPLSSITRMDFDAWGDLYVIFTGRREKVALKSGPFSARQYGERLMGAITLQQAGS